MNRLFLKLAMTAMAGKRISLSRRTGFASTLRAQPGDNLDNPITSGSDRSRSLNSLAIGDLMALFDFTHKQNKNDTPLIITGGI